MDLLLEHQRRLPRRHFFGLASRGIGTAALSSLLNGDLMAGQANGSSDNSILAGLPHHQAKIKRVIYLFQSGGPAQQDLFDYKPKLDGFHGTELPDSIRQGQRLTGMTAAQTSFPVAPSRYAFGQHGQSGAWVSELLPYTAKIADQLCFIKSMHTTAINHDPAITFLQTGAQLAGRPSIGSWLAYGLGSESEDLPAFVVMVSRGKSGARPTPLQPALGEWIPAHTISGREIPIGPGPGSLLEQPARIRPWGTDSSEPDDDLARLNQLRLEDSREPGSYADPNCPV